MLLCDTLHLIGYRLFDRKRIEEDKKKENKSRLLGFESKKQNKEKNNEDGDEKYTQVLKP